MIREEYLMRRLLVDGLLNSIQLFADQFQIVSKLEVIAVNFVVVHVKELEDLFHSVNVHLNCLNLFGIDAREPSGQRSRPRIAVTCRRNLQQSSVRPDLTQRNLILTRNDS